MPELIDPQNYELLVKLHQFAKQEKLTEDEQKEAKSIIDFLAKNEWLDDQSYENHTVLIAAAFHGSHEMVRLLIEAKVLLDERDDHRKTALTWAAYFGYDGIVEQLIQAGARYQARALEYAMRQENLSTVSTILRIGEAQNPLEVFNFLKTCKTDLRVLEILRTLCEKQQGYKAGVREFNTAFFNNAVLLDDAQYQQMEQYCKNQHINWLRAIFKKNEPWTNDDKNALRHILGILKNVSWFHIRDLSFIVNSKLVNREVIDHEERVRFLIETHPLLNQRDSEGDLPLALAARAGLAVIAEQLIATGAALEQINSDGNTALDEGIKGFGENKDQSIQESFLSTVYLLLKNGAIIRDPQKLEQFLQNFDQSDPRVFYGFKKLSAQHPTHTDYFKKLESITQSSQTLMLSRFREKAKDVAVVLSVVQAYEGRGVIAEAFCGMFKDDAPQFFKKDDVETLHNNITAPRRLLT